MKGKMASKIKSVYPRTKRALRRAQINKICARYGVKVDEELYKKIKITNLILFGINSVIEKKEKCTFERLIKECFTLFPQTFSFSKYSQWPDSLKLDRQLRALRKRKLITGNPKTSFALTKLGKKLAEETARNFRQKKLFK